MDPITVVVSGIALCMGSAGLVRAAATKSPPQANKADKDYEDLMRLAHAQGHERERLAQERERRLEESER